MLKARCIKRRPCPYCPPVGKGKKRKRKKKGFHPEGLFFLKKDLINSPIHPIPSI
jgi:hypothetical protein